MLLLNDFRNYVTTLKEAVSEITVSETVMDDSQLTKFMEAQTSDSY